MVVHLDEVAIGLDIGGALRRLKSKMTMNTKVRGIEERFP